MQYGKRIVDATAEYAAAYTMQFAFYEAHGLEGMRAMEDTLRHIRDRAPDTPVIADAKRCDISSTAAAYAQAIFGEWGFDSATLVPYMGADGIAPFLAHKGKTAFVVCHTSNPSAVPFQTMRLPERGDIAVFEYIADMVAELDAERLGLVMGATYPERMAAIRRRHPRAFLLSPGVGAQGGDLAAAVAAGTDAAGERLLINASRSIANADDPARAALELRDSINAQLNA